MMIPQLTREEMSLVWQRIGAAPCFGTLSPQQRSWVALWSSVTRRNAADMWRHATALLPTALQPSVRCKRSICYCAHCWAPWRRMTLKLRNKCGRTTRPDFTKHSNRHWSHDCWLHMPAHAYAGAPIPYLR